VIVCKPNVIPLKDWGLEEKKRYIFCMFFIPICTTHVLAFRERIEKKCSR